MDHAFPFYLGLSRSFWMKPYIKVLKFKKTKLYLGTPNWVKLPKSTYIVPFPQIFSM